MKIYNYRYFWKKKDNSLCVKYVCETEEGHLLLMKNIRDDNDIVSCYREYVNEIDTAYIGFTSSVKEEDKGENENEEKND